MTVTMFVTVYLVSLTNAVVVRGIKMTARRLCGILMLWVNRWHKLQSRRVQLNTTRYWCLSIYLMGFNRNLYERILITLHSCDWWTHNCRIAWLMQAFIVSCTMKTCTLQEVRWSRNLTCSLQLLFSKLQRANSNWKKYKDRFAIGRAEQHSVVVDLGQ